MAQGRHLQRPVFSELQLASALPIWRDRRGAMVCRSGARFGVQGQFGDARVAMSIRVMVCYPGMVASSRAM
jgi:hypothetical protein